MVVACETIGPESIEQGRPKFNAAVQDTGELQLLTNIARIHRNELPLSTLVTQIIASVSPEQRLAATSQAWALARRPGISYRQSDVREHQCRHLLFRADLGAIPADQRTGAGDAIDDSCQRQPDRPSEEAVAPSAPISTTIPVGAQ